MQAMSRLQIFIIFGLLFGGVGVYVLINFINVVAISLSATFMTMGLVLLFLECGPCVWLWWVPFGFGHKIYIKQIVKERNEINSWINDNIPYKFLYVSDDCGTFYFLRKTDAMGFKLRWV